MSGILRRVFIDWLKRAESSGTAIWYAFFQMWSCPENGAVLWVMFAHNCLQLQFSARKQTRGFDRNLTTDDQRITKTVHITRIQTLKRLQQPYSKPLDRKST